MRFSRNSADWQLHFDINHNIYIMGSLRVNQAAIFIRVSAQIDAQAQARLSRGVWIQQAFIRDLPTNKNRTSWLSRDWWSLPLTFVWAMATIIFAIQMFFHFLLSDFMCNRGILYLLNHRYTNVNNYPFLFIFEQRKDFFVPFNLLSCSIMWQVLDIH